MTQRSAKVVQNKKKSLCEKSMLLVANIIKLSSISLVSMSCGTTSLGAPAGENSYTGAIVAQSTDETKDSLVVPEQNSSKSQRSQEPESGSKRGRSYLMEPPQRDMSPPSYDITREKKKSSVDDMANDFIQRAREKMMKKTDHHSNNNSAPKRITRKLLHPATKVVKEIKFSS